MPLNYHQDALDKIALPRCHNPYPGGKICGVVKIATRQADVRICPRCDLVRGQAPTPV